MAHNTGKTEYEAYKYGYKFESGLLDHKIECGNCKQETTRRDCEMKPSFYDDITYHNYYCNHCGEFIRCDSQLAPLPPKKQRRVADDDEGDNGDE